ncbi:glycosyltransferase family 2 protein [Bacteroides sp. 214]|uniref:glycosyltransferase family A protein n=1 Tax=Bacteroides sp. 214 TaxID=2302935 RepID=UPI0013D2B460|nr:glycosyltransferase family A protein [Bacteroides sp. 214]NDW12744.1 glycosyltransferase family 2 protein [Bacteroides sp. 214]
MNWYTNYLSIFEKPFSNIPESTINHVHKKLDEKKSEDPIASVILIAHNEESRITSCLWSLAENICQYPIEILVVNNNSTDKTEEILNLLGVTYFNESKKGPGHARQRGLNEARGKYHICIDSDTMYPPYYIETHIKALMKPGVVCVFGLWSFIPTENYSKFGLWVFEALRDIHLQIQAIKRPELCVRGMVFSFNTELGRKIGFRTDIIRGEDGSLALGLKPHGKLKLLTTRKARALTSNGTLNADGSLFNSFKVRFIKGIKGFTGLFSKKSNYEDEDSNLIKNK